MGLRGGPTISSNKSKMADGGHTEFCKNANIFVVDEDIISYKDATWGWQAADSNWKTAFSLQRSREPSDDNNFQFGLIA